MASSNRYAELELPEGGEERVDRSAESAEAQQREVGDGGHCVDWLSMPSSKRKKARKRARMGLDAPIEAYHAVFGPNAVPEINVKLKKAFEKNQAEILHLKDVTEFLLSIDRFVPQPKWINLSNRPLVKHVVLMVLEGLGNDLRVKHMLDVLGCPSKDGENGEVVVALRGQGRGIRAYPPLEALLMCPASKVAHSTNSTDGNDSSATKGARKRVKGDVSEPQSEEPGGRHSETVKSPQDVDLQKEPKTESERALALGADLSELCLSESQLELNDFPLLGKLREEKRGERREEEEDERDGEGGIGGWISTEARSVNAENANSTLLAPSVVAIDCEMVQTDQGLELARVAVVDYHTKKVLRDTLVRPERPVVNYLTRFSGISEKMLEGVEVRLADVQRDLCELLFEDTILVGHSLENDLRALKLLHNRVVDTSVLFPHSSGTNMKNSLRYLADKYLDRAIQAQEGEQGHNPVEDAVACIDLLRLRLEKGAAIAEAAGTPLINMLSVFVERGRTASLIDKPSQLRAFAPVGSSAVAAKDDDVAVAKLNDELMSGIYCVCVHLHEVDDVLRSNADEAAVAEAVQRTGLRVRRAFQGGPPGAVFVIVGAGYVGHVQRMHSELKKRSVDSWTEKEKAELLDAATAARRCFVILATAPPRKPPFLTDETHAT